MLVAGQVATSLSGSLSGNLLLSCPEMLIFTGFVVIFITTDNESNKKFKENRKKKNNKPDIRLQVLWCPLPDFVADSLCSAFFMEVMLMAKNKTSIKVTAVFDGELDATDVFVSLIAQQYARQYTKKYHDKGSENIHSENVYSKNISKDFLAKSQETAYNDSEVQKSQPSGLCG